MRLTILALLAATGLAGATSPIARFTLSIEGIADQPRMLEVSGIEMNIGVVEVDDGVALRKEPAPAADGPLTFWLPEVGDEVLVFRAWMDRVLAAGAPEGQSADLIGYDARGNVLVRWRLANVWPSRISLAALELGEDGWISGDTRPMVTLQHDGIEVSPGADAAPWPHLNMPAVNPERGTITLSWPSAAGAAYDLYRLDAATGRPVLDEGGIPATGDLTFISRLMEEEGIYYVVLVKQPAGAAP